MYPYVYAAPNPPTDAEKHVRTNGILMCIFAFLHFCGIGSVILNLYVFSRAHHGFDHLSPNALGELIAYGGAAVWAIGGVIWAPINAYGLFKRRPWARTSSLLYWAVQCLSCCCMPFGAYGLYSLTRPGVKSLFDYKSSSAHAL